MNTKKSLKEVLKVLMRLLRKTSLLLNKMMRQFLSFKEYFKIIARLENQQIRQNWKVQNLLSFYEIVAYWSNQAKRVHSLRFQLLRRIWYLQSFAVGVRKDLRLQNSLTLTSFYDYLNQSQTKFTLPINKHTKNCSITMSSP